MDETVDAQAVTIGAGTVIAVGLLAYGTFVSGSAFGTDATTLAIGAFVLTFAALAVLHGTYGRLDFAAAYGVAGVGLGLVAPASSWPQLLTGYLLLAAGGSYVAVSTVRARVEDRTVSQRG